MKKTTTICDHCGVECVADGHGYLTVKLTLVTMWNPDGDTKEVTLCRECRAGIMGTCGFSYDCGKLLGDGEYVTGVEVYGPNGGGIADLALNGFGGADPPHVEKYEATEIEG